jgi:hypothetical protein
MPALALLAALASILPAHADGACLSRSEARAAYPGSHLYWHGRDRCWDDRRKGQALAQSAVIAPAIPLSVIDRRWPDFELPKLDFTPP